MIDIKDLSFHFGLRTLFEDTSVMIQDGQKVGLVGPNGCGKSTLFKLIEGKFSPDGGKIDISRGTQIASVAQEITDPSVLLLDYVLSADKELSALQKELENPAISGERMAEIGVFGGAQCRGPCKCYFKWAWFFKYRFPPPVKRIFRRLASAC